MGIAAVVKPCALNFRMWHVAVELGGIRETTAHGLEAAASPSITSLSTDHGTKRTFRPTNFDRKILRRPRSH